MSRLLLIVDADAIVAQANTSDSNHKKATIISRHLAKVQARLLYPTTAVAEAVTALQRKLNQPTMAYGTAALLTNPEFEIIEVDAEIYSNAVSNFFTPITSKKNTIFDCIIASCAEKYNADAIFSFDKFYKNKGFKLASELK